MRPDRHAHPSMTLPARAEALRVSYGAQSVLQGLDWQVPVGQVCGLLGRNGAGKTTLLETLLGLRDLDAGRVELFGQDVKQLDDKTRSRIGYVPQDSALFAWLTADQLLAYFRSFYPRWNHAKVEALLGRWAIDRSKPIGQLSGGQRQRLSIIRALAHEPDLLILDEPVSGLDPAARRDFLQELVSSVVARGASVVFSTHILSDLERVAVDVAFLARGRIALQAPLDELMETTRQVSGSAQELQQARRLQSWEVLCSELQEGGRVTQLVRLAQTEAVDAGLPAGVRVSDVSLDNLYLALTA